MLKVSQRNLDCPCLHSVLWHLLRKKIAKALTDLYMCQYAVNTYVFFLHIIHFTYLVCPQISLATT